MSELQSILAEKLGELMYLRDNCRDYFVRALYQKKIDAINVLLNTNIIGGEEEVI